MFPSCSQLALAQWAFCAGLALATQRLMPGQTSARQVVRPPAQPPDSDDVAQGPNATKGLPVHGPGANCNQHLGDVGSDTGDPARLLARWTEPLVMERSNGAQRHCR